MILMMTSWEEIEHEAISTIVEFFHSPSFAYLLLGSQQPPWAGAVGGQYQPLGGVIYQAPWIPGSHTPYGAPIVLETKQNSRRYWWPLAPVIEVENGRRARHTDSKALIYS